MTMTIKIKETSEMEELSLIDPKSGTDWTGDLLGNHDAEMEYDDDTGTYTMTQENYDWWSDLINRYQAADDTCHELLSELDDEASEELQLRVNDIGCDLENYPESLLQICNEHGPKTMIIAEDSCNGEQEEFKKWLNENHPSVITKIENTMDGGLYDWSGDRIVDENYWDQYCSS